MNSTSVNTKSMVGKYTVPYDLHGEFGSKCLHLVNSLSSRIRSHIHSKWDNVFLTGPLLRGDTC